jgi:uncharacterized protein YodC (DUF2158 family)
MQQEFNVGDVVQLKSGGPKMTIEYIGPHRMGGTESQALCVWFEGTNKKNDWFKLPALEEA